MGGQLAQQLHGMVQPPLPQQVVPDPCPYDFATHRNPFYRLPLLPAVAWAGAGVPRRAGSGLCGWSRCTLGGFDIVLNNRVKERTMAVKKKKTKAKKTSAKAARKSPVAKKSAVVRKRKRRVTKTSEG